MSETNQYEEVSVFWTVDESEVHGSLARPLGKGRFPAVIFMAGSGPTDRNWNSPAIPGTNGSGAQLSRALSESGFITLRFDKLGSGPNVQEDFKRMFGKISMRAFRDQLGGGVRALAEREDVDARHIFALTNSEGWVHAINYQIQQPELPFAGLVLTSAFARPAGELAHSQIAAQLAAIPDGEAMLAAYDSAIADFLAGRPVQVDETLPKGLRDMILAITGPGNQPFSRELWAYNPVEHLAEIAAPVLIVLGKKDIQVDWQVDGGLFEAVAKQNPNINIAVFENANHVLKHEPRPRAQLTAADAMATYSAENIPLDPDVVEKIRSWLKAQT